MTVRGEDESSPEKSVKGSFADTRSVVSNEDVEKVSVSGSMKKSTTNGHSGIIVSNFDVMSKIEMEFNKQKEEMKKKEK